MFKETSIILKNTVLINIRAEMKNKTSYKENNILRVAQNFVRRFISATFFCTFSTLKEFNQLVGLVGYVAEITEVIEALKKTSRTLKRYQIIISAKEKITSVC